MKVIETGYFKISPGRYVRQAFTMWISTWWWLVLLPLAVLIYLGFDDARFFIVALALIFVVYPGIMILLYFNYALRPEAALSVLPHKLVITESAIEIVYEQSDDHPTPKPRYFSVTDIDDVEDCGTYLMVHLKSGKYDFIDVPVSTLKNDDIREILTNYSKQIVTN